MKLKYGATVTYTTGVCTGAVVRADNQSEGAMAAEADAYDGEGLAAARPATDHETVIEEDAA